MLHILRTTAAVGVVAPGLVAQEHSHAGMEGAGEQKAAASWAPRFFNAEQNATVIALGERIIPGSTAALCNRLIDSILLIESEKNKTTFLHSLAAFDNEAQQRHQHPFRQLSSAQQDAILTAASQTPAHRCISHLKRQKNGWPMLTGRRRSVCANWVGPAALHGTAFRIAVIPVPTIKPPSLRASRVNPSRPKASLNDSAENTTAGRPKRCLRYCRSTASLVYRSACSLVHPPRSCKRSPHSLPLKKARAAYSQRHFSGLPTDIPAS